MTDNDKLLTLDETVEFMCDELGYPTSKPALQRKRRNGGGPKFTRVGTRPLYRKSDLRAFVAALPVFETTGQERA
ncbi:helix-turn-helix transcriptional regulator [Primorskyibacter sp. S87]|uniref:helix-turn-helix transcriptional regulator n=1 Tax=Primorskyibacter sp. S87 TaxID=3415126 RepID=UPI003C7C226B